MPNELICDIMNKSIILNREGRHYEQKRKACNFIINFTFMCFRCYGDPWMCSSERNQSDGPVSGIFAGKNRERKTAAVMTAVFCVPSGVRF